MRKINEHEKIALIYLSNVAGLDLAINDDDLVWEVNSDMGSIRSSSCQRGCRIKAFANCQYIDDDEIPVVITLLLKLDGSFGELDFWKVNDQAIISHPDAVQKFSAPMNFNKA